jgi:hypothetical protein
MEKAMSNIVSKPKRNVQATDLFGLICDMEDDVQAVLDFADLLALAAEALGEHDCTVQRIAWEIAGRARRIETKRGILFDLAHPDKRVERINKAA